MDESREYFLTLLSDFLKEEKPSPKPEPVSWKEIEKLAEIHSVSGIIGFMVKQLPDCDLPDEEILRYFNENFFATVQRTSKKVYLYENLIKQLDAANIPHVSMKGIVVRTYYPQPELRTFGDVDILIQKEDAHRLTQLMTDFGYTNTVAKENELTFIKGSEYYEMHLDMLEVSLNDHFNQKEYFKNAWQHVEKRKNSICSYIFSKEYHFIYLLAHLAKHVCYGGAGIRLFLDIAVYIGHFSDLNWEYIWKELEKLKLKEFTEYILSVCGRLFGIPIPAEAIKMNEEDYRIFCDYILSAGTFGFYGRNAAESEVRRNAQSTDSLRNAKRSALIRYLFPPYSNMRQNYKFVDGRPVLLPVAWLVRFFKVFTDKRRQAAVHMERISSVDSAVEKQRRLFDQLGLK